MYLAYSAKLLKFYPEGVEFPIPELPGWTARRWPERAIYTVTHNLNTGSPLDVSIQGIALEQDVTANVANVEGNSFVIMSQKQGEEFLADFMFVLVLK